MLRHICQLKLLISIWKLVVHTKLTECQPREDVLVSLEGLDISVTQFLEAKRLGRYRVAERYGQCEKEWAEKPKGPQSLDLRRFPHRPYSPGFKGRGVWGTRAGSGRQLKS